MKELNNKPEVAAACDNNLKDCCKSSDTPFTRLVEEKRALDEKIVKLHGFLSRNSGEDALDKAREENKMLRLQIFAFVRNSAVLPVGRRLNKSEQEITDKTFETIEAAKNMIDVEAVKAAMNLATKRENRFNNAD